MAASGRRSKKAPDVEEAVQAAIVVEGSASAANAVDVRARRERMAGSADGDIMVVVVVVVKRMSLAFVLGDS